MPGIRKEFGPLLILVSLLVGVLPFSQAAAQDCSPDRFVIQFVDEVVLSIPDSVVVTGIPTIDTLNVLYKVVSAESVFLRPLDMAPADSALYDSLGLGRTYLFGTRDPIVDSALMADYAADPDVEVAELDCEFQAVSGIFPNDPGFGFQWGFHNDTWNAGWPDADKNAPEGWLIEQDAVLTAIIDTGVDRNHEDLDMHIWMNSDEAGGDEGVDDDENGYVDDIWGWNWPQDSPGTWDNHGHGTHVAGIAGAIQNNGKGVVGQGWSYRFLMCLKALDAQADGQSSWISQAIFYAANKGAKVINLSLGSYNPSAVIRQSIDFAYGKGCVIVAAIGNDDTNLPFYPAAYDNVIAIGATNGEDDRAWFSNHGSYIDVVAPGEDIYSTYPGNSYQWESGTSMAAPHVSGLAAMMRAANPGLDNSWVRYIIRNTSDDEVGDLAEDVVGFDEYYGHGRINDYSALAHSLYPIYLPLLEDVRISSTTDSMTFMISHATRTCEERWEIVGVRMPENPDFQLAVWDSGGGQWTGTPEDIVEFIVIHQRSGDFASVLVDSEGDCGKYAIEWTVPFDCVTAVPWTDSEFGPYQWQSAHVVALCCIQLFEDYCYEIDLDVTGSADLGMALFKPCPDFWDHYYDRWSAVAVADEHGVAESETLTCDTDTTAWYPLAIWSNNGRHTEYTIRVPKPTDVPEAADVSLPATLALGRNHPNPFGSLTSVRYDIPSKTRVVLSIYDTAGRRVATLVDQMLTPGGYTAHWNGRDETGIEVAPGVYFCGLRVGDQTKAVKMVLTR